MGITYGDYLIDSGYYEPKEEPMPVEDFRWLIEAPGARYLAARKIGNHHFHWTQDHNAAIAFRSEAQADMTMMAIRDLAPTLFDFERTLGNAKAVEHAWMACA